MPYETSWYIEKRVLGIRFHGDVTVDEVVGSGDDIRAFVPQAIPPLSMIVDARDITKYPTDLKNMLQGMKSNHDNSTKIERTVVISENRLINFFGTMISNVFSMPIRTSKSLEDAEAYLAHHDETLEAGFATRHASTD